MAVQTYVKQKQGSHVQVLLADLSVEMERWRDLRLVMMGIWRI